MRTWSLAGRAILIALVLCAAALTGASCGADTTEPQQPPEPTPSGGPDITGLVWQVTDAGDGSGSLYVVGLQGGAGSYDRASVAVTAGTAWRLQNGSSSPPPLDRELVGRRVAVTFSGAVAESYPVQAAAGAVRLLDPLGVSMDVVPAGIPQVHGRAAELVRDEAGTVVALRVRRRAPGARLTVVPVSAATIWLLDTPTEFKPSKSIPLIGNGLEPLVDARLAGGVAVWVAVSLPH
jgi:hypothetical protein